MRSYLNRFIQPDTIVPDPGNPQSLNSYTLNNPVRYSDPTGMFSEDEIMNYFGATTWDDVLAMFGEGDAMAGRWGYLEALRQAQLGTPISMWFDAGTGLQFNIHQPDMIGSFYETEGELMFSGTFIDWSGSGGSWAVGGIDAVSASKMLAAAAVYQAGSLGNYLDRHQQYTHLKFDGSRVDWVGVGLDAAGIAADVVSLGAGGRAINGIQIAGAANDAGQLINGASLLNSGVPLSVDLANGTVSAATAVDFGLDVAGIWVPIVPDVVSLVSGLGQGYYVTP